MAQLFVLGPAFGHPSIDAECTAAIALLRLREIDFTITQSHTGELPLLIDGKHEIAGFSNICHHLNCQPSADDIALSALIETRAPILLQAYLYIGENYSATRTAFTPILPFHARFIVPGNLRATAKANTAQLGIDEVEDEKKPDPTVETTTRSSLLLPKAKTVRSLLQPEQVAAFKLRNLADAVLQPLDELLDDNTREVHCLAYGYLGLMSKPSLPQPWLRTIIREHYPALERFVQRMDKQMDKLPPISPIEIGTAGVLHDLSLQVQSHLPVSDVPTILLAAGSALIAGAAWLLYPMLSSTHGDAVQMFGGRPALNHVSSVLAGLSIQQMPHIVTENELPAQASIELES